MDVISLKEHLTNVSIMKTAMSYSLPLFTESFWSELP